MGKGSTVRSGAPTFKTGTIRTPAEARVTARLSVPKTFVASDPLTSVQGKPYWYGNPSIGEADHGPALSGRESFDFERAGSLPAAPTVAEERQSDGTVTRSVKRKHAGVVRTLGHADAVTDAVVDTLTAGSLLHTAYGEGIGPIFAGNVKVTGLPAWHKPAKAQAPRKVSAGKPAPVKAAGKGDSREAGERKAARKAADAAILGYLRSVGYKGTLTADVRELALDAMAYAETIAAYAADR